MLLACALMGLGGEPGARAQDATIELYEKLTPQQRQTFDAYSNAKAQFARRLAASSVALDVNASGCSASPRSLRLR